MALVAEIATIVAQNVIRCRGGGVGVSCVGVKLSLLDPFAARHHGLVTIAAAADLNISRDTWFRGIKAGLLIRVHPGVARVVGVPVTREQMILAAVLAAGDGAVASHRSAAFLWGVTRPVDDPIDIILPNRHRQATLAGVVTHRPRDLKELRAIHRSGVPTTTPMRMLVDRGAVDPLGLGAALEETFVSKVARPPAVRAGLVRHAKRGRTGITALRAALDAWPLADHPGDSALEARMAELIVTYRLPPVRFHQMVAGFEVDFRVVGTNVVLECDGYATHGLRRDQFEFDRVRDAEVTAAGFITVRFTWRQITAQPSLVARRIEAVLRQWAPDVLDQVRTAA